MDIKSLLESAIESLSNNCSIETIMLKAQAIAYILKDDDFKKRINCEQNGYTDDDLLPTYRIIGCQVHLDISGKLWKIKFMTLTKNMVFNIQQI